MLDTSAVETDADDNETGKRDRKPTTNNDFALLEDYESDTESDDEPQPKRFKAPSDELSNRLFHVVFFLSKFFKYFAGNIPSAPPKYNERSQKTSTPKQKKVLDATTGFFERSQEVSESKNWIFSYYMINLRHECKMYVL